MQQNDNGFRYRYSAPMRDEVEAIRQKYLPPQETKLDILRRLDRSATRRAAMAAAGWGSLFTLLLGAGMSLCLVWGGKLFVPGILLGVAGMAGMALALPLYHSRLNKERQRIAPQVLQLADELTRE